MYSTAKRLSSISAIACALNIFSIVIFLMGAAALEISNFPLIMGVVLFLVTSAIISLLLTLSLRGLCQDLDYEFDNQTKKFRDLNERVKNLENR